MVATKAKVSLFLILIASEQVWSDTIPHFYNFSESTGWFDYDQGNWKFTYNNAYPDGHHPQVDSDAGYTFSQDKANSGFNGLASPPINGVDKDTIFSFSFWYSSDTAFPGSGIEFYSTPDSFGTLLPIGLFRSNNVWEVGTVNCAFITCCDTYPCNAQILVLNSNGDSSHQTVSALQWFSVDVRTTTLTPTSSTIVTSSTTTTTAKPSTTSSTTMTTTETQEPPTTSERPTTTEPPPTTTTPSTTTTPTTTTKPITSTETTAVPSNNTVMYNFSSCTTEWFNYGDGDWKFTCMDEHPDILHPHIDSDVGYTFSQDGLDIPMVGLSSPVITGVNAQTVFTFSYWFSLSTAFPGSVGLEFYSSIDNFGTLKPLGNFLANDEWTIGTITCSLFKCCATYPCDLQIMVLNTKGDVDHPTVAALQWFLIEY